MKNQNRLRRKPPESSFETTLYVIYVVLVVGLPLLIFPWVNDPFGLPKATLLWLSALALLVAWTLNVAKKGRVTWKSTDLSLPLIFFSASIAVSVLLSSNWRASLAGGSFVDRYEGLPTWLSYVLLAFLGTQFAIGMRKLGTVLRIFVMVAGGVSIYGIAQHFGYDFLAFNVSGFAARQSLGTLGQPTFLGSYLVLALPLAVALFLVSAKPAERIFSLVCGSLVSVALIFTYNRGAWVGAFSALLFLSIFLVIKRTMLLRLRTLATLFSILLAVILVASLLAGRGPNAVSVLGRIASGIRAEGTVEARLLAWQSTLRMIGEHPITGWGPETMQDQFPAYAGKKLIEIERHTFVVDRPHNQFLYIGYAMGAFGLLGFAWILIAYFWCLRRIAPKKNREATIILLGIWASAFGYIVQEQFGFSTVNVSPLFWMLLGLSVGVVSSENPIDVLNLTWERRTRKVVSLSVVVLGALLGVFLLRFMIADYEFVVGMESYSKGLYNKALDKYRKAIFFNPWKAEYRFYFGQTSLEIALGNSDRPLIHRAIVVLEEGTQQNQRLYNLQLGLGNLHYAGYLIAGQEDDLDQAKGHFRRAAHLVPYSSEANLMLAKCYLEQQRYPEAVSYLSKSLRIPSDNPEILYELGKAYEQVGQVNKSMELHGRVLELDPLNRQVAEDLERLRSSTTDAGGR